MPPRKRRSVDYPACILQQKSALGTQRAAQLHVVVETATWLVNHCGGYIRKRHRSTEHRLAGREQADVPFQSHGQQHKASAQPVVHPAHLPTRPPVAVRRDLIARRCDELIADLRAPGPGRWRPDPPQGGGPLAHLPRSSRWIVLRLTPPLATRSPLRPTPSPGGVVLASGFRAIKR